MGHRPLDATRCTKAPKHQSTLKLVVRALLAPQYDGNYLEAVSACILGLRPRPLDLGLRSRTQFYAELISMCAHSKG